MRYIILCVLLILLNTLFSQIDSNASSLNRVVPQQLICCEMDSIKMSKWIAINAHKQEFVHPILDKVRLIDTTESHGSTTITGFDRKNRAICKRVLKKEHISTAAGNSILLFSSSHLKIWNKKKEMIYEEVYQAHDHSAYIDRSNWLVDITYNNDLWGINSLNVTTYYHDKNTPSRVHYSFEW